MSSAFRQYRRTPSLSNASVVSDISSRTKPDEAIMDVYRESQLNGFRRLGRKKATGQFVQEDVEDDSGQAD